MRDTVLGLLDNTADADAALEELGNEGYTEADVSVITREDKVKIDNDAGQGIKDTAKTGGIIGGIVGLLVGLGALAIPGIGALFIAGPLAAAFGLTGAAATTATGAITGALAGGLLGALKEIGIDEVQARSIEEQVKQGDTLLLVIPSEEDAGNVKDIMERHNGHHISEMNLNI
jgi:uncharacterized membrane protein